MAYGSDYSAVQAADLQEQKMRQDALLRSYESMQQSFQNLAKLNQQQQQLEVQKQEHADSLAVQREHFKNILSVDGKRNDLTKAWQDFQMQQIKTTPNPAQARVNEFQFKTADQNANQGFYGSAGDVLKMHPDLSFEEAKMIAAKSQSIRPQYEKQWQSDQQIADIATQRSMLRKAIAADTALTADDKTGTHWYGDKPDIKAAATRLKENTSKLGQLPAVEADKYYQTRIVPNVSGGFDPATTKPHWLTPQPLATGDGAGTAPGVGNLRRSEETLGTGSTGAGAGTKLRYAPEFYSRVNELIGGGLDPAAAKRQAMMESQESNPQRPDYPVNPDIPPEMKRGGIVKGKGTGTSDSVAIKASKGEFIMPAAALKMPGVLPLLQHIRGLALGKKA